MAGRVQALALALVEQYDGDVTLIWRDVADGRELFRRLAALPGFGTQKAQIFTALLGKQRGVTPPGWREAAGGYGEEGVHRSVADVVDAASLGRVREYKQAAKAAAKADAEAADDQAGGCGPHRPSPAPRRTSIGGVHEVPPARRERARRRSRPGVRRHRGARRRRRSCSRSAAVLDALGDVNRL